MTDKKIELLAPAGNYQSFVGAIHAGADAVYLGGEKFGARAFADNFDTELLCKCIRYAHLFGKKVYLTLNTLVKEEEFSELYEYVNPFYLAGLDGVIVQDLGVLAYLKTQFYGMELHASTQMAITGKAFVSMCKELGISRVVPARELSLEELKAIKDEGIEVEAFIHGAMCYCYSGMCLMSSVLGGRSGNRGKCAQPCRLPYDVEIDGKTKKNTYTLSLKDMCTIEHVGELIEAGVDSFKIEGRMKRSEYAAGVTALYRKYIDMYMDNPNKSIKISSKDQSILKQLYMRSELQDGYLFKQNGKDMLTSDKPSYNQVDQSLLESIESKYIKEPMKKSVSMYASFVLGERAVLTLTTNDGYSVTCYGEMVEAASNKPATVASIQKQLQKVGNTNFTIEDLFIDVWDGVFLPNATLNQLRRDAFCMLENEIIDIQFPKLKERKEKQSNLTCIKDSIPKYKTNTVFQILVRNKEQLIALIEHPIKKKVKVCYIEHGLFKELQSDPQYFVEVQNTLSIGLALPYIVRNKDHVMMMQMLQEAANVNIDKILVRNLESLALIQEIKDEAMEITTDADLYVWNKAALQQMLSYAQYVTLPYELGKKERAAIKGEKAVQVAYGYIPLMLTANCIYKTNDTCDSYGKKVARVAKLKDRYDKKFPVLTDCRFCYNQILNSVPLSLHNKLEQKDSGILRLQFSMENQQDVKQILNYYMKWSDGGEKPEFPYKEFTTVHENRRVE